MSKQTVADWLSATVAILGGIGYVYSLFTLKSENMAIGITILSISIIFHLWQYALTEMTLSHIILSFTIVTGLAFFVFGVQLLYSGAFCQLEYIDETLFYTCPR